jgi:hypothetical protein
MFKMKVRYRSSVSPGRCEIMKTVSNVEAELECNLAALVFARRD